MSYSARLTPIILLALIILVLPTSVLAASPRLYLDPATATVAAGSTVTLELKIDTADQEAAAADAKISFPPATIGIVNVTAGEFFPKLSKVINSTTGLIDIHSYFDSADPASKSGAGTVAIITIKGTAAGTAALTLSCTSNSTIDSNIADPQGQDIINCTQSSGAEITVKPSAQGGGSILTPTPTPSTLPKAGVTTPTIGLLAIGTAILMIGSAIFVAAAKLEIRR